MSDKQWGHGYNTGKKEVEQQVKVIVVAAVAVGTAIGVGATWLAQKLRK